MAFVALFFFEYSKKVQFYGVTVNQVSLDGEKVFESESFEPSCSFLLPSFFLKQVNFSLKQLILLPKKIAFLNYKDSATLRGPPHYLS